jgi:hypothetical protein
MTRTGVCCTALAGLLVAAPLDAQRLAPALLTPPATSTPRPSLFPAPTAAPSYWLEGAVLGGVLTGGLGASLGDAFCRDSDSGGSGRHCLLRALEGFMFGAIPGFTIGGLIGGALPKAPSP